MSKIKQLSNEEFYQELKRKKLLSAAASSNLELVAAIEEKLPIFLPLTYTKKGLHIGHLMPLVLGRRFADQGHQLVILLKVEEGNEMIGIVEHVTNSANPDVPRVTVLTNDNHKTHPHARLEKIHSLPVPDLQGFEEAYPVLSIHTDRVPIMDFYKFWLETDDNVVIKYIDYFTYADEKITNMLERKLETRPDEKEAQDYLAIALTSLVYTPEETAVVIAEEKKERNLAQGNI